MTASFATGGFADYHEYGGRQSGSTIIEHLRGGLGGLDATQHLIANVAIELSADVANTHCALQARHIFGGDCYTLTGSYRDRLVRERGVWRIAERHLRVFFTEGRADVMLRGVDRLVAAGGEDAAFAERWRDSISYKAPQARPSWKVGPSRARDEPFLPALWLVVHVGPSPMQTIRRTFLRPPRAPRQ